MLMGLRELPDILYLIIFHFGGNIGNGSLCNEISLIAAAGSPASSFDNR
jgi:hypothetical protein